jgi:hypothetical protein
MREGFTEKPPNISPDQMTQMRNYLKMRAISFTEGDTCKNIGSTGTTVQDKTLYCCKNETGYASTWSSTACES